MENRKLIGLVAAAAGVLLLALAAFSQTWIIGESFGTEYNVGLRSVDICSEGAECVAVDLEEWEQAATAPKGLSTYVTLGTISFVLCLACAGILGVLLIYGLTDKTPYWPVHPGTLALLLTICLLVVGVLTLALHPFKDTGWGTGPGFMILAGGDISALVAGLILGRSAPMSEDDWFE